MKKIFLLIPFLLLISCSPKIKNTDSQGSNIICFGNSITEGVGATANTSYPAYLSRIVDAPIINAGHAGDTTADGLRRIERDVLSRNPYLVIVEFGANDFLRHIPKEKTFQNLKEIISCIQDKGAMVVLLGIRMGLMGDEYESSYKKLARETDSLFIPHILRGIISNPQLKSDGLHPNALGYELIAQRIAQSVRPYVKQVKSNAAFAQATARDSQQPRETGNLTVLVRGLESSQGDISMALDDNRESYLSRGEKPSYKTARAQVKNKAARYVFKDIPYGTYTLKLYHDQNENGKIDKNLLGIPTEPYAFSNNVRGTFGLPAYEKARFMFSGENRMLRIEVP